MEARAIAKYVRMSPTKVGVVLDLIRGKKYSRGFRYFTIYSKRCSCCYK